MPIINKYLTKELSGTKLDPKKMKENGWSDQGGKNYHFGFPQEKGLWLKRIKAAFPCEYHMVWLFVLLYLGKGNVLKQVKEAVHRVYNDGSYVDMRVAFFPPDVEASR